MTGLGVHLATKSHSHSRWKGNFLVSLLPSRPHRRALADANVTQAPQDREPGKCDAQTSSPRGTGGDAEWVMKGGYLPTKQNSVQEDNANNYSD